LKNTDPSSILRSEDFISVDTNKNWQASIDLKAIDYGQFLLVSVICYDQNQSGLEERIITQDSDIFWTTYTLDLSGEGEGANQFAAGTKYVKFNIVATTEGPIWFDNAIFANEKNFAYNAANQIANTGFSYDDNGNLTSDGELNYIYDGENRLKEVKQGTNTIAAYAYDYMGRRTSKTVSGQTAFFHYDGWNVVAETDQAGTTIASYTYDDRNQLVSMTRGSQTYYYQYNAHGDVVSLTNSASQVVNTYEYDPWGEVLSANETVDNPYRYAGYRYDTETELYYLQHRYYDAGICRFLTRDPYPANLKLPQTLNFYAYCINNPINLIDPSGLDWLDVGLATVGVFAAGAGTVAFVTAAPVLGIGAVGWAAVGVGITAFGAYREYSRYSRGGQSGGEMVASIMLSSGSNIPILGPAFAIGSLGLEIGETVVNGKGRPYKCKGRR